MSKLETETQDRVMSHQLRTSFFEAHSLWLHMVRLIAQSWCSTEWVGASTECAKALLTPYVKPYTFWVVDSSGLGKEVGGMGRREKLLLVCKIN